METISEFEKRSYISFLIDRVLVWKSEKEKKMKKTKVERWDLATARRYIHYLEEEKCQ